MNGRRARIIASALGLALLLMACSDNGSDSSGGALTKAQYIAKADKICQSANQKTQALGAPTSTDPQALAKFLGKSGQIITDAVGQLKKLNPPKGDEQKINQMVGGLQKSASYFPDLIQAVKDNDRQKIQQVAIQLQQASQQGGQIAQTYGFHVCAQAVPSSTGTPTP
jgi:hypothetical protein